MDLGFVAINSDGITDTDDWVSVAPSAATSAATSPSATWPNAKSESGTATARNFGAYL